MKQTPKNTSKYQTSAKLVKRFGSYEYLKFRPTSWLKYKYSLTYKYEATNVSLSLCRIHQVSNVCQTS